MYSNFKNVSNISKNVGFQQKISELRGKLYNYFFLLSFVK